MSNILDAIPTDFASLFVLALLVGGLLFAVVVGLRSNTKDGGKGRE